MRIASVTGIGEYTLLVYYTPAHCYQISIIDDQGSVYMFEDIYYGCEAALRDGQAMIQAVLER